MPLYTKHSLFTMKTVIKNVKYSWKTRRAWWFTATARTRERFARTTLGSFWLGLSNLLSMALLATFYGTVFKVPDFNSYIVYLGTGLILWNAIATSIQTSSGIFRSNALNLKNTNMHPIFYSLEEWSFQIQTFAQSFSLVLIALTFFQNSLIINLLGAGVLPFINLILFMYWFPLIICLIGSHFEDLFQLIPIILQLLFLLSPVLYRKEALGALSWTADFNPLYQVMASLRNAMTYGDFDLKRAGAILLVNTLGIACSLSLLENQRKQLPFLM